jgi:cyclase
VHRTLIVARMRRHSAPDVARVFAESDATELPHLLGVSRRTLFSFHDLYFHLVEADHDIRPNLNHARNHPRFQEVNTQLQEFIEPYDPAWQEPKDAMAHQFYVWTTEQRRRGEGSSRANY